MRQSNSMPHLEADGFADLTLLSVEAGGQRFAFRSSSVVETLRPLPLVPINHAPAYVLGHAIVRGEATLVLDLGMTLGAPRPQHDARWIRLRLPDRPLILAVAQVLGVRTLSEGAFHALDPLILATEHHFYEAVAIDDEQLLTLLATSRIRAATEGIGELGERREP